MIKNVFKKQEKEIYGSERLHVLQYRGIREFFVLCCIGADAYTLYSVFDLLMTERIDITRVITITIAAVMNIIPVLLAACLWNEVLSRTSRKILCTMLISLFTLLFVWTFGLRYTSRDLLFESTTGLDSFINQTFETEENYKSEGSVELADEGTTIAQDILAIILGLEPLATSIVAFVLSYEVSPYRKRKLIMELNKIELRSEIDNVTMMIRELTEDMAFDRKAYDEAQFNAIIAMVRDMAEEADLEAKRILAESEGTPEAVEYILEGGWKNDSQNYMEDEDAGELFATGNELKAVPGQIVTWNKK